MSLAVNTPSLKNKNTPVSSSQSIKVMVVDDSAVVRGLVSRWVSEESGMEIVARHANGQKAVEDVATSQPDIVILDVEMPVMDGLEALPQLLRAKPGVKIVMASTLTQRNAEISMKALSLGATDYIPKPDSNSGITTSASFRTDLVTRIRSLGGARKAPTPTIGSPTRVGQARTASIATAAKPSVTPKLRSFSTVAPRLLVVGSSTGGPQALAKLFAVIGPRIRNVPVLITQHMPATFTAILAKHLGEASGRPSREAVHREVLVPGHIYVAPGGYHMRLKPVANGASITLDQEPEINFCRPAVDPLFESAALIYSSGLLATILTGMGSDGANGGRAIAAAGGSVIAQDEETSVVWGMPGAAAAAGICSAILPLGEIGPKINSLLR
ncbi:MAG: chemotaxis response regulator protein-glutamate methylesterase [bacterium]|nr:chemotaxis response regulator protein-glutamate methylesterase [bacterium]